MKVGKLVAAHVTHMLFALLVRTHVVTIHIHYSR